MVMVKRMEWPEGLNSSCCTHKALAGICSQRFACCCQCECLQLAHDFDHILKSPKFTNMSAAGIDEEEPRQQDVAPTHQHNETVYQTVALTAEEMRTVASGWSPGSPSQWRFRLPTQMTEPELTKSFLLSTTRCVQTSRTCTRIADMDGQNSHCSD